MSRAPNFIKLHNAAAKIKEKSNGRDSKEEEIIQGASQLSVEDDGEGMLGLPSIRDLVTH